MTMLLFVLLWFIVGAIFVNHDVSGAGGWRQYRLEPKCLVVPVAIIAAAIWPVYPVLFVFRER